MYLKKLRIVNVGPIADFELVPEFHENGRPKPLVLVGGNGSGKTNTLSVIADALYELAASRYSDIRRRNEVHNQPYFRVLGGSTTRRSADFEFSAARFGHGDKALSYVSSAGKRPEQTIRLLATFGGFKGGWDGNGKHVEAERDTVRDVFETGVHVFLPANRSENSAWALDPDLVEPGALFARSTDQQLGKPIVVDETFDDLKPWIVDVMLDSSVDVNSVVLSMFAGEASAANLRGLVDQAINRAPILHGLNLVVQTIFKEPQARIVRTHRSWKDRKVQIWKANEAIAATLEAVSAGQASLLSIFCTVLRYGDRLGPGMTHESIQGVVLVDEIDAHLHSDLQHDVLPRLIGLFPQVQFIVTSHAPLFPLGLEKRFGQDGFTLVEMPSGTRITAERFSEFAASYAYLKATKAFEADLEKIVDAQNRPLITCEGETDPKYLRTAAELLGFPKLLGGVDVDWIGERSASGAAGGGKDKLDQAFHMLKRNPQMVKHKIVLVYDADSKKPDRTEGNLFVRSLPDHPGHQFCNGGVEVLIPPELITPEFIKTETKLHGARKVTSEELDKVALCDYLCDVRRQPADFELFRPFLQSLNETLGIVEVFQSGTASDSPMVH